MRRAERRVKSRCAQRSCCAVIRDNVTLHFRDTSELPWAFIFDLFGFSQQSPNNITICHKITQLVFRDGEAEAGLGDRLAQSYRVHRGTSGLAPRARGAPGTRLTVLTPCLHLCLLRV